MNPYCRLIPRLNGYEIEEKFDYYLDLVRKGVAGFIIFGGRLDEVRTRIRQLRELSGRNLLIASDLEQGLGQQIEGGTLFPPSLAIASAMKTMREERGRSLLGRLYAAIAAEARYAGINAVLAPVLDINTNPRNPIIATRAFGDDPETVSLYGCAMIETFQQNGIIACGKHFPGHGDTEIDSHISLPVIKKDLRELEELELVPFQRAVDAGVGMVMLGHLSVPALDSSGMPASLSAEVVDYLRRRIGFGGIVITDAMNMGAIGEYNEKEASFMALRSGVDFILHPTDPDGVASYLLERRCTPGPLDIADAEFRKRIAPLSPEDEAIPDFDGHGNLSEEITRMAITIEGERPLQVRKPFVVVLNEDGGEKTLSFVKALGQWYPETLHRVIIPGDEMSWEDIPVDAEVIVAVFSSVRAWKGRTSEWLREAISSSAKKAKVIVSFGNPYVLNDLPRNIAKMCAFWGSETAQRAAAEAVTLRSRPF